MNASESDLCRALNQTDRFWRRVSDSFIARVEEGRAIESFPDLSEAESERVASCARSTLAALDTIDIEALPHQLAVTIRLMRFQLGIEAQAADRYWIATDCGGFPAMFSVGPYGGGQLFSYATRAFTGFTFARPGDCDRYLALIEDYGHFIVQMRRKLEEQAARDIRIPQPALAGMRLLVAGQANAARRALEIDSARLAGVGVPGNFTDIVALRIQDRVLRAFAELLDAIGEDYAARAPVAVGIAQFEEGAGIYEGLVTEHLSMPMTIEAVHRAGHDRMQHVEAAMKQVRESLGYPDRDRFHRYLRTDPSCVARSAADVQARFDAAIRRIEPRLGGVFRFKPAARYRTAPLDSQLEAGMTFGYYQMPVAGHPDGVYYFNSSNVTEWTLATIPSLIYHELIPGHHFHLATQKENDLLHPLRQNLMINAFNEGWAEYAATLAGEMGMYDDPCERYGRLLMDAFLTSRLVVDTGMNALGWSLEQARAYMREHTILCESEIRSETLRYSTDIPAQSLAYKFGEIKIHQLRERARNALGSHFDIRDFHDVVLGSGGMPLEVLDWHVSCWLDTHAAVCKSAPQLRDLVTHDETVIEAAPTRVWPHIVDPSAWKQGAKLVPIGGESGRAGERFNAISANDPRNVLFCAENVEMVAEHRRTVRLDATDGTLIGFATWRLTPRNGSTVVEYDVYCRVAGQTDNTDRQRFTEELEALKRIVEASPSA